MGGLTILEQMCGLTMTLAALGCVLMLYAGLALERQRQALARLQGERVQAARRAHIYRRLLTVAYPPRVDVVVIWGGAA